MNCTRSLRRWIRPYVGEVEVKRDKNVSRGRRSQQSVGPLHLRALGLAPAARRVPPHVADQRRGEGLGDLALRLRKRLLGKRVARKGARLGKLPFLRKRPVAHRDGQRRSSVLPAPTPRMSMKKGGNAPRLPEGCHEAEPPASLSAKQRELSRPDERVFLVTSWHAPFRSALCMGLERRQFHGP